MHIQLIDDLMFYVIQLFKIFFSVKLYLHIIACYTACFFRDPSSPYGMSYIIIHTVIQNYIHNYLHYVESSTQVIPDKKIFTVFFQFKRHLTWQNNGEKVEELEC